MTNPSSVRKTGSVTRSAGAPATGPSPPRRPAKIIVVDQAEQYLCAAVLRPGKAVAANGTLGLLCRLLPLLRAAFPRARFLVRLDGGFATPEIFDFLDAEPRLDYVVASLVSG